MAITSGFFNSHDHDRRYTAAQLSNIFKGLITDGIYRTIGTCFATNIPGSTSGAGNPLAQIGTGRGWFDGYWVSNDSNTTIEITSPAPVIGDRWDAIVFEVDTREFGNRNITLRVINGVADETDPQFPSMETGIEGMFYHPLCYIKRDEGTGMNIINDGDHVISAVGNDTLGEGHYTRFVSSVMESVDAGQIWNQWNADIKKTLDELKEAIGDISEQTILPDSVYTNAIQNGAVTGDKLAADQKRIVYENVPMSPEMFTETGTYEDYPFRGQIPLDYRCTEKMVPDVMFGMDMIATGAFAPIAEAYNGGVFVYADDISEILTGTIIPTIVISGGVSA